MTTERKRPVVVIADDHVNIHALLRLILEPEFDVAEAVVNGQALVEAVGRLSPDLIVVDVAMPVLNGIDAVRRLKAQSATAAIVFISTDSSEENVLRALQTGALGFVRKASAAEDLVPAARAVLKGLRFVSGDPGTGTVVAECEAPK